MNATKILWGQVLLVSAVVLAFVWAATEWTAWRLAFQPQLGHPWFEVLGWPVYQPPAFFWWWFAYDAYAREIFVEGAYIAASGGIAAIVVAVAISVWRAREAKKVTTYGSARWAEAHEVRQAGMLGPSGCTFDLWADDVPTCAVELRGDEVWIQTDFGHADAAAYWQRRLEQGMAHNLGLVIAKAIQGQLAAGVPPIEIVRQAALFGARSRDGWDTGMTILTALGNLLPILPEEETYLALFHGARRVAADCDGAAPARAALGSVEPTQSWYA
jgi:hypothetical protein